MADAWARGDLYDAYVGRWSRLVAPRFLEWVEVPAGHRWMDVGSGTGALVRAILDGRSPTSVVGVEPSPAFAAWAAEHVVDDRARFVVADAVHLPDGPVDAVVSGLVLNFVPDPAAAVAAMRAAASGGTVAAYVWDYGSGMQLMRHFWDAAIALDPAIAERDELRRFPLCTPDRLSELWRTAGMSDVTTTAIEVPTVFVDFDDYWRPFLGGQGPAPGYAMSLVDERRAELRESIRAGLPVEPDGSIHLTARAWAVRGTVGSAGTAPAG